MTQEERHSRTEDIVDGLIELGIDITNKKSIGSFILTALSDNVPDERQDLVVLRLRELDLI